MTDAGYRKKVLLVDDDPLHLEVATEMLKDEYEVSVAKSGKVALERLYKGYIPDLVLLDILMPNMDGWEVFRRIRAISSLHDVPVAFFTSLTEKSEIEHAHNIGVAGYLVKPFKKEELLEMLVAMFDRTNEGENVGAVQT